MFANAFTTVFRNKTYTLIGGVVSFLIFAFAVWLPNIRLLFSVLTNPTIPASDKLILPLRLLESITTNFTVLSASYTIAIALLTGINVALIVYYVRRQKQQLSQAGMTVGTLGIVSGVLGMGCAACGSLILTSIVGTTIGAGIIGLLPLRGSEFGIVGVVLLTIATYLLAKQITKPFVCEPINLKP